MASARCSTPLEPLQLSQLARKRRNFTKLSESVISKWRLIRKPKDDEAPSEEETEGLIVEMEEIQKEEEEEEWHQQEQQMDQYSDDSDDYREDHDEDDDDIMFPTEKRETRTCSRMTSCCCCCCILLVVLLLLFVVGSQQRGDIMDCPVVLDHKSLLDKADYYGAAQRKYAQERRMQPLPKDDTLWLDHVVDPDATARTYLQMRASLRVLKMRWFGKNLASGDSILDASCSTGLNLYLTLSTLANGMGIHNLNVYGAEYYPPYIQAANATLSRLDHVQRVHICRADPSNLTHLPSNRFDLAYMSSMDAIVDPLDGWNGTVRERLAHSRETCGEPRAVHAQLRQQRWFHHGLQELLRVAKPGKVVVMESVQKPLCDDPQHSTGGVAKTWWNETIARFRMAAHEPVIRDDPIRPGYYHVAMRKKQKT